MSRSETSPVTAARSPVLVYLAVFGGYLGQQMVMPILPPLARELRLSEVYLGLVMTVSAMFLVVAGPFWGRRSDVYGRKPVILAGLAGVVAGLLSFAVVAHLGLDAAWPLPVLLGLIVLTRSVLFGAAITAVVVAAPAYVADVTTQEKDRIRGLSLIGAVTGLALVLGPAIGGLLGRFGLIVPLYAAPLALLPVFVLVALRLPAPERQADRPAAPKVSPFDRRLWPFVVAGFALYLSLALMQITIGFLLQDRLGLDSEDAARITGFALLSAGLPLLVMQGAVVPKLGWSPVRLLRAGVPIVALGLAMQIPDGGLALSLAGLALMGVGFGFAAPGFSSGPTLRVQSHEQGGVAGVVAATIGLTFVVGPVAGTALYEASAVLPFICGTVLLIALMGFLLLHPGLRRAKEVTD